MVWRLRVRVPDLFVRLDPSGKSAPSRIKTITGRFPFRSVLPFGRMTKPPSIPEFLKMIISGWFGALSGTLGVVCGIVSLFWDSATAKWAFYIASVLGLLTAAYRCWKAERERCLASEGKQRPVPQPLLSVVLNSHHGIAAPSPGFHVRNIGRPALDLTIDNFAVGIMAVKFQTVPDVLAAVDGGIERLIPFSVGQTDDEYVSYDEDIELLFLSHPPEINYRVDVVLHYWDVDRQCRYKSVFKVEIDTLWRAASTTFVFQAVDDETA